MSTINQCTKCITGETKIIQFYRLCITCSAVGVCLNCAGICHENHTLGPLLREKFYCQCHQITNCCRALNQFADVSSANHEGNGTNGKTAKKRKFNGVKSEKIYVWTKHNKSGKLFLSPCYYQTKEEANQAIKQIFIQQNPWHLDEKELYFQDSFTMQYNEQGLLTMKIIGDNNELWESGADIIDGPVPADSLVITGIQSSQSHDEHVPPPSNASHKKAKSSSQANNHLSPVGSSSLGVKDGHHSNGVENHFKLSPNTSTLDDDDDMVIFTDLKPRYEDFADVDKDKGKKKSTRPKKEAGAPKGPVASYMMFSNTKREQVVAENPGLSMIEISRTIGQHWKSLSAEEKQPYEELAKKDKERYAREMEEFKRRKSNGEAIVFLQPPPKAKGKPGPKPKQKPAPIPEIESVDHEADIENASHDSGKVDHDDDSGSMLVESSDEKKSNIDSGAEDSSPENVIEV